MANIKGTKNGEIDKRKRILRSGTIALIVISALLTVLALAGGWLFMSFIGYTKADNEYRTENIRSGDEFIECMSARIVSHEYRLLADIEIDAELWNKTMDNIVLRGALNGNGHKVTIVGELRIPLFSRIESNAEVSHVSFAGIATVGEQATMAALAAVNYGKVTDCTFVNAKATVGSQQYVSFVVAHNFGKIQNCVVSGRFTADGNVAGRTAVGAVSAINYKDAEIKNCIVEVKYMRGFDAIEKPFFSESEVNDKIGYAVGQNNGKLGKIYCINAESFANASDGKTGKDVDNIKPSDLTVQFISSLDFVSDYWNIAAGKLPTLKIMVEVGA